MDSATLEPSAEQDTPATLIAQQYLDQLPANYLGRYSEIADASTLDTLFKGFAAGLNQRDCCAAAGIAPVTFQRWLSRAEAEPDSAFAAFDAHLKACRAQGKLKRLQKIEAHGVKEWTALAWMLERTDPEQFALRKDNSDAPRVVVQIGVRDGDVQVSLSPSSQPVLGEGVQNP